MTLACLYLRSRRAARATALLAAVAAAALLWRYLSDRNAINVDLMITSLPVAAATIIGASAGTPFRDVEDTAGHWLPALRLSHLAGLLLLVAGSLAVVTVAWQVADIQWSLVRDLALFAGLALLRAGLAGSGLAWILPAGYAFAAFLATILTMGPTQQQLGWTWSLHAAREWEAAVAAAILLLAGLGLVVWRGARDNLGERA